MLLLIVPEQVRDCLLCLLFILLELYCSLFWFYPSAFFLLLVLQVLIWKSFFDFTRKCHNLVLAFLIMSTKISHFSWELLFLVFIHYISGCSMRIGWCCIQPSQQWFMLHSYLERSRILDLILEVASLTSVSDAVRVYVYWVGTWCANTDAHEHGPKRVALWEDPMNPGRWKEEHVSFFFCPSQMLRLYVSTFHFLKQSFL